MDSSDLDPSLNHGSLDPHESASPNGISIGSAVFVQFTADTPYAFEWAGQPTKVAPFTWGIRTPSNTWFLGRTRVILPPNGISIG